MNRTFFIGTSFLLGVFFVVFACNKPKRASDLNNHQIDSVLTINKVPKDLISFTSFPEKRIALQAWYTDNTDSLKPNLLTFSEQRKEELLKRNKYQQFMSFNDRNFLWVNLLTSYEMDSLKEDRAEYWLKYNTLVDKRKSLFTYYRFLKNSDFVKWKEEGMISTVYYDSISIVRWKADSIQTVNQQIEYLENVNKRKGQRHKVDIKFPFGSKELYDMVKKTHYNFVKLSDQTQDINEFDMYKPLFEKDGDPISESVTSDRLLPFIDSRMEYWETKIEKEDYNTEDMETNPVEYFSYKFENIKGFEMYFYGQPYEMYSNKGNGYLTLYNRDSKTAYVLLCVSQNQMRYFYVDNNTIYLLKNIQGNDGVYTLLTHEITFENDEVFITEFLPFSKKNINYENKSDHLYFNRKYQRKFKFKDYIK